MTWLPTVRADVERGLRSRAVWGVYVVLVVGVVGTMAFLSALTILPAADVPITSALFIELFTRNLAWLTTAGLMLLVLSYAAVSFPDEQLAGGSASAFLGLFLPRAVLVTIGILLALVVGLVVATLTYDSFDLAAFALFGVLTMGIASVYVAIGLALATVCRSVGRTMVAIVGVFFVVKYLWDSAIVPMAVAVILADDPGLAIADPPDWFEYVLVLSPNEAYAVLGQAIVDGVVGTLELVAIGTVVGWLLLAAAVGYRTMGRR